MARVIAPECLRLRKSILREQRASRSFIQLEVKASVHGMCGTFASRRKRRKKAAATGTAPAPLLPCESRTIECLLQFEQSSICATYVKPPTLPLISILLRHRNLFSFLPLVRSANYTFTYLRVEHWLLLLEFHWSLFWRKK